MFIDTLFVSAYNQTIKAHKVVGRTEPMNVRYTDVPANEGNEAYPLYDDRKPDRLFVFF